MKCIVYLLLAVASGASGWALSRWLYIPETKVVETVRIKPQAPTVAPADNSVELDKLRRRISELERELSERDSNDGKNFEAAVDKAVDRVERNMGGRRRHESFMERMSRMKKEDPAKYAEIVKRHDEYREHRRLRAADKADFFESLDVSSFSPQACETHRKLLEQIELVARQREKIDDWANGEFNEEERTEQYRQLSKMYGELRNLYEEERHNLLVSSAKSLGLNASDAEGLVSDIKTIYNATQVGGHPNAHNAPPPPFPPHR